MSATSITYHYKQASEIARDISACENLTEIALCEEWVASLKLKGKLNKGVMARVEAVLRKRKDYIKIIDGAYSNAGEFLVRV